MEKKKSRGKKKDELGSKTAALKLPLWNLCRVNSDKAKLHLSHYFTHSVLAK